MEDQVMALKLSNVDACLMGTGQDQKSETNQKIMSGKCKILYLTPEFLESNVELLETIHEKIGKFTLYAKKHRNRNGTFFILVGIFFKCLYKALLKETYLV